MQKYKNTSRVRYVHYKLCLSQGIYLFHKGGLIVILCGNIVL